VHPFGDQRFQSQEMHAIVFERLFALGSKDIICHRIGDCWVYVINDEAKDLLNIHTTSLTGMDRKRIDRVRSV